MLLNNNNIVRRYRICFRVGAALGGVPLVVEYSLIEYSAINGARCCGIEFRADQSSPSDENVRFVLRLTCFIPVASSKYFT